jgi:hypothetical protein
MFKKSKNGYSPNLSYENLEWCMKRLLIINLLSKQVYTRHRKLVVDCKIFGQSV